MVQAEVENSHISIICISNGSVSWRFKELNAANYMKLVMPDVYVNRGSIKIYDAKIKHTGVYECEGFLPNGTKFSADSTLYVASKLVV